jgi:dCMP deaminase
MLQIITDIQTCIPISRIKELLIEAYKVATNSPDPSTQNGALLVTNTEEALIFASDCNRFPDGIESTKERWERPLKYEIVVHAERNVIYSVAKSGEDYFTEGAVMVCPWAACPECAQAIIQSGIKTLITHKQAHDRAPEAWVKKITVAFGMLDEAGVSIVMYDGDLNSEIEVRHSEKVWIP